MKKNIILVMLLSLFFSCSKENDKKVVIASKPHSEQYILGEMLTFMIEQYTDITVEKKLGIGGGTSNIHPGMISGKIDIYPEYTGTGWLFVLKQKPIDDSQKLYENVKKMYADKFNIKWFGLYGFNNTYALAMKKSTAKKYGIKTMSDLAKHSSKLVFGANYDFYERDDGFPGLVKKYGYNFKDTKEIDIGLKYQAVDSDKINVTTAFTTDGLLLKYDLKILKDDKRYFKTYYAATLIREETLQTYPELEDVLSRLEGQISEEEMIQMNYRVENDKEDPKKVAEVFLKSKGLL